MRSFSPLASATPRHSIRVWASICRRSKSLASTVIRPAPIRVWSSKSSSRAFIIRPASVIRLALLRDWASGVRSSAAPARIAPIGVRRSWPMAARKVVWSARLRSALRRDSSARAWARMTVTLASTMR